jgi:GTP cyclohydrolase II
MKVNQKVWKVEINLYNKEEKEYSWQTRKNGVVIEELKILGISEYKVVLNNKWFTTLDVLSGKKETHETYLDDIGVYIRTNDDCLGDGVFAYVYSTEKPSATLLSKMQNKISDKIDKDYGFLFSGVKDRVKELVSNYEFKN